MGTIFHGIRYNVISLKSRLQTCSFYQQVYCKVSVVPHMHCDFSRSVRGSLFWPVFRIRVGNQVRNYFFFVEPDCSRYIPRFAVCKAPPPTSPLPPFLFYFFYFIKSLFELNIHDCTLLPSCGHNSNQHSARACFVAAKRETERKKEKLEERMEGKERQKIEEIK